VDKAAVTYEREMLVVDGEKKDEPEIRFNLTPSLDKYHLELASSFSYSCNEIEEALNNVYPKTTKLYLISRFIVEVEAIQTMLQKKIIYTLI
jgi:hypothetical protein